MKLINDAPSPARLKYDPSSYVLPAADVHGISIRKQFRCQPTMSNEIGKIIQSKRFPWQQEGDFMRWAVWEGIKRVERMEDIPDSMYSVALSMMETCQMQLMLITFSRSLEAVAKSIGTLQEMGMEGEALKHLSELRDNAARVVEPQWREKYMKEFDRRFGHLYEKAKRRASPLPRTEK